MEWSITNHLLRVLLQQCYQGKVAESWTVQIEPTSLSLVDPQPGRGTQDIASKLQSGNDPFFHEEEFYHHWIYTWVCNEHNFVRRMLPLDCEKDVYTSEIFLGTGAYGKRPGIAAGGTTGSTLLPGEIHTRGITVSERQEHRASQGLWGYLSNERSVGQQRIPLALDTLTCASTPTLRKHRRRGRYPELAREKIARAKNTRV